ncbi:TolC family protein [Deminuibacter soli]|uniref:TolC family protein n=1 Tax=Deminuibacter soli TaxID=2291815 RepID=A0A3E1NL79_9BACT|nr:TolC family protein [Deminuibacter soli]RFM28651.1 TolC family protein [Deminuibacter soli]
MKHEYTGPVHGIRLLRAIYGVLALACLLLTTEIKAQELKHIDSLSLQQAVQFAVQNNKHIGAAHIKNAISSANTAVAKNNQLPDVDFHTSYERFNTLTEYRGGLNNPVRIPTIHDMYDITLTAKVPLYAGNRIKNEIVKSRQEEQLAALNTEKTENDVHLEVVEQYLGIYKLMRLDAVMAEQEKEDERRLKEVQALKRNGAVTKNEILRAELQLSDLQLTRITNHKNITIACHDLQTTLGLPEEDTLVLDTMQLLHNELPEKDYAAYAAAAMNKDEIRQSLKEEAIAQTERKIVKGAYYPTIGLFGQYAYKYPDYMMFPPTPYLYSLGMVGVDVSFSISNLYKNKKKMAVADKKIALQQMETSIRRDEVNDRVFKAYTQYTEMLERVPVTEKAIQQAEENYHIVKTKYLNQLALITDMIDADNSLLQARFNNVAEHINVQLQYYRLQYASGNINTFHN